MQDQVDIEFVQHVAREAGERALLAQQTLREVEFKEDGSYVTEIDRDTEQFVRQRLAERYPHHEFLGEEFGGSALTDAPLWAIDPIDGTTNMVNGIPFWGVSLGLTIGGEPAAGVFYMPCTGEMFSGVTGAGGFRNGKRLHAHAAAELHRETTLGFTSTALKVLPAHKLEGRVRCLGSIAGDIAYTASGALSCIIGCHEGAWDMAATLCIAREAGCEMRYLSGEPVQFADVLREGKTRGPFAVAPPQTIDLLQALLQP